MPTYLLIIAIIVALIAIAVALFMYVKRRDVEAKLLLSEQQLNVEKSSNADLQQQLSYARDEANARDELIATLRVDVAKNETLLQAEIEHNAEETQLRREQFEQQLQTAQKQFENLANKVLDSTGSKLKSQSEESFKQLTQPLQTHLQQLQQAIANTNELTAKNSASLSEQLRSMSEQTKKIDQTASNLTNVMLGKNKGQGRWGERILTELLEMQGFRKGFDFDVKQTMADASGQTVIDDDNHRKQPDVILHYPQNEDVIIDAKMSIENYYQYVEANTEHDRNMFADRLVSNIRNQYKILAKKDYSNYVKPPRHSIDFVIMFVPNDGALQLALSREPKLWNEAFENKVFITGQQNLMAILKMIQLAWRQYQQSENQKQVYELASDLLSRLGDFNELFLKIGKSLDAAQQAFDAANKKAYTGRQSVIGKANQLKEIGAKENPKKPIPPTDPELTLE